MDRERSNGGRNAEVPSTEMMKVETHAESRHSSHLEQSILPVRFIQYLPYSYVKKTYKCLLEINHKSLFKQFFDSHVILQFMKRHQ